MTKSQRTFRRDVLSFHFEKLQKRRADFSMFVWNPNLGWPESPLVQFDQFGSPAIARVWPDALPAQKSILQLRICT